MSNFFPFPYQTSGLKDLESFRLIQKILISLVYRVLMVGKGIDIPVLDVLILSYEVHRSEDLDSNYNLSKSSRGRVPSTIMYVRPSFQEFSLIKRHLNFSTDMHEIWKIQSIFWTDLID